MIRNSYLVVEPLGSALLHFISLQKFLAEEVRRVVVVADVALAGCRGVFSDLGVQLVHICLLLLAQELLIVEEFQLVESEELEEMASLRVRPRVLFEASVEEDVGLERKDHAQVSHVHRVRVVEDEALESRLILEVWSEMLVVYLSRLLCHLILQTIDHLDLLSVYFFELHDS